MRLRLPNFVRTVYILTYFRKSVEGEDHLLVNFWNESFRYDMCLINYSNFTTNSELGWYGNSILFKLYFTMIKLFYTLIKLRFNKQIFVEIF